MDEDLEDIICDVSLGLAKNRAIAENDIERRNTDGYMLEFLYRFCADPYEINDYYDIYKELSKQYTER